MKSIVATRHNIIANYIGAVWTALMGFVFVPFYLRYIGADGYGLVGVFLMLSSIMAIFDGGLGMVASRECAAFAGLPEPGKRDTVALLRTMEAVFWLSLIHISAGESHYHLRRRATDPKLLLR